MIRQYRFIDLMHMLTDDHWFVMKSGDRYFFAQIVR